MTIDSIFPLGRTLATPAALLTVRLEELERALVRHAWGDWGECLSDEDRRANDLALHGGGRLLSAYEAECGEKFWIITEADRSATTVLLPSDY